MRKPRAFKPEFKARVVLEELTGVKTSAEICREHQINPQDFARWKDEFIARAPEIFVTGQSQDDDQRRIDERTLPSLDAHAHIDAARTADELADAGIVLAMTNSLDEASLVVGCREPNIAWGVGCHPRQLGPQESFSADLFRELAEQTAVVGEIGLDGRSRRVPLERQLQTFRQVLETLSDLPRLVSIHADGAEELVIEELAQRPVAIPVIHGWRGHVKETREAVALGCYFSIHSGVAGHSKFRTAVPPERLLIETDHHRSSLPAAIPYRVKWVEYIVAKLLGVGVMDVRRLAWQNFGTIVRKTGTRGLLPEPVAARVAKV
jgi:TatD DNase family protein